jgi:hypothetical protein
VRRPNVVAVLVLAIVGVAGVGLWANDQGEPRFCKVGLAAREVDGHWAALQDQGDPGPDRCDMDEAPYTHYDVVGDRGDRGGLVLGFDCAVRDRDGEVVTIDDPNRPDGTCGQDEA